MRLEELSRSTHNKVVALEVNDDAGAVLFVRDSDSVKQIEEDFRPFLLLEDASLLDGSNLDFDCVALNSIADFCCRANFLNIKDYFAALEYLKKATGRPPSAPGAPYKIFGSLDQQVMAANNIRLFHELDFDSIHRLQFDIETLTSGGYDFSNPEREEDRIIIISFCDNRGWEKVISLADHSEKELLEQFVRIIVERDPDVIEGHNICRFDLPYIETRAKHHKVKLSLGRNGKMLKKRNSRFSAAERTVNYTRYEVFGRHVVDTLHLTMLYDVSHRDLESYSLKYLAKHFHVASEQRTYIDGDKISDAWHNNRENLLKYALDDVRETAAVARIMAPSSFYQAQILPFKYQDCVVRGNATKIDALLLTAYLDNNYAVPRPEFARAFTGALTRAFDSGLFKNIWHCDVRSLYPSIILADKMRPGRDVLDVFSSNLNILRRFRLEAKDAEKAAGSRREKDYFNALQSSFKILINSFYGYLGFSQGAFNDFDMAEAVTARGREILSMMLDFLEKAQARVIEMDTDGIYFSPPENCSDSDELEKSLQDSLPDGIDIELDAKYAAMFCYKSKNYALLSDNGEMSVTGAALKSRGLEEFQREYIHNFLSFVLHGQSEKVGDYYNDLRQQIQSREIPLSKLAKREVLNDSPDSYMKKIKSGKGRRSAAYELAAAARCDYRRGDQIAFYVTGEKKRVSVVENSCLLSGAPAQRDENTQYYLAKLDDLHKKFGSFI